MSWAWLEHSLSQQPLSTHCWSSPPAPLPCAFLTLLEQKDIIPVLVLFLEGQFQMLGSWVQAGLLPCSDWGDLVADHGHQWTSWKSGGLDKPHLEKKRGGVSRGSPPPGCSALAGVTPLTLVELPWFSWRKSSPINSIWFMALRRRERELQTCSPQGSFGGWLSRCVFYCVYCLSDDRN